MAPEIELPQQLQKKHGGSHLIIPQKLWAQNGKDHIFLKVHSNLSGKPKGAQELVFKELYVD